MCGLCATLLVLEVFPYFVCYKNTRSCAAGSRTWRPNAVQCLGLRIRHSKDRHVRISVSESFNTSWYQTAPINVGGLFLRGIFFLIRQIYGFGIPQITFGPNSVYFHGGEMPRYNSFMGYDPVNDVTLIIWTSLTISLDGQPPANTIMLKLLNQIYTVSPRQ
jgi:hypothetical protein